MNVCLAYCTLGEYEGKVFFYIVYYPFFMCVCTSFIYKNMECSWPSWTTLILFALRSFLPGPVPGPAWTKSKKTGVLDFQNPKHPTEKSETFTYTRIISGPSKAMMTVPELASIFDVQDFPPGSGNPLPRLFAEGGPYAHSCGRYGERSFAKRTIP
jgi:hypothetical protein